MSDDVGLTALKTARYFADTSAIGAFPTWCREYKLFTCCISNPSAGSLYGTLEQKKLGDVVSENAQTNKRKKSFVFEAAFSDTTSPCCTTIQSTSQLTSDPIPALYVKNLLNGTRIPIRYSWMGSGQPRGVWDGNPIEKAGLAGISCRGQLPQYLYAGYVPHMCGNVLSSRIGKSGSKVGPMRTEKW